MRGFQSGEIRPQTTQIHASLENSIYNRLTSGSPSSLRFCAKCCSNCLPCFCFRQSEIRHCQYSRQLGLPALGRSPRFSRARSRSIDVNIHLSPRAVVARRDFDIEIDFGTGEYNQPQLVSNASVSALTISLTFGKIDNRISRAPHVGASARVDLDRFAFLDEERDIDRHPGFEFRRLRHVARSVAAQTFGRFDNF